MHKMNIIYAICRYLFYLKNFVIHILSSHDIFKYI